VKSPVKSPVKSTSIKSESPIKSPERTEILPKKPSISTLKSQSLVKSPVNSQDKNSSLPMKSSSINTSPNRSFVSQFTQKSPIEEFKERYEALQSTKAGLEIKLKESELGNREMSRLIEELHQKIISKSNEAVSLTSKISRLEIDLKAVKGTKDDVEKELEAERIRSESLQEALKRSIGVLERKNEAIAHQATLTEAPSKDDHSTQISPTQTSPLHRPQETNGEQLEQLIRQLGEEKKLINQEMHLIIKENVDLQRRCYENNVEKEQLLESIKALDKENRLLKEQVSKESHRELSNSATSPMKGRQGFALVKEEELKARERALQIQEKRMLELERELFAKHEQHKQIIKQKGQELEEKMKQALEKARNRVDASTIVSPVKENPLGSPSLDRYETISQSHSSKYFAPNSPDAAKLPNWIKELSPDTQKLIISFIGN
jgi:hypothetical protein